MTEIELLADVESGYVPKEKAMQWLHQREVPSEEDFMDHIVSKPYHHTGSTYAEEISDVRVKGSPEFLEAVAGFFRPFLKCENNRTRLEINLQRVTDRDTGELTDAYSLHLKSVDRGTGRQPTTLDAIPDDGHAIE